MILSIDEALIYSYVAPKGISDQEIDGVVEFYTDFETMLKEHNVRASVDFSGNGVRIQIDAQELRMPESKMNVVLNGLQEVFYFALTFVPAPSSVMTIDEVKLRLRLI